MHADLRIGDSPLWLADECPDFGLKSPQTVGGSPVAVNLFVGDVDKVFDRAVKAGAKVVEAPTDQFWGARYARIVDPSGHAWGIATQTREVTPEEMGQAMKKMAAGGGK